MLPIGVALSPVSNSHVNRLDLMIIVPGYATSMNRGDLVLACRGGWWNTACVIGILNGNGNNGGNGNNSNGLAWVSVISNGNGLRGSLPVNGEIRLFRIVWRIPGEVWIPALTMYLYYLAIETKKIFRKNRVLGENTSIVSLTAVITVINAFIVGSTFVDQVTVAYALPEVRVSETFYLHNSSLIIRLSTQGDYILLSAECNLTLNGANGVNNGANRTNGVNGNGLRVNNRNGNGFNGNGQRTTRLHVTIIDQRTILVEIPFEVYYVLFNRTRVTDLPVMPAMMSKEAQIPVRCRLGFDKFEMQFTLYAVFYWRDIDIRIRNLRWLQIENTNPVDINVTLTIFDIDKNKIVLREAIEIPRLTSLEFDLWELNLSRARVILEYELLGLYRMRIGYYDREPWRRPSRS